MIGLIIAFGLFADYFMNRIIFIENEKQEIYISMLVSAQHILNNILQKAITFRNIAKQSKGFDPETIELYNHAITETTLKLNRLKDIKCPSKIN